MSFELALVLSFVLIVGTVGFMVTRQVRAREARRDDEFRREASGRGWKFQVTRSTGVFRQRWEGTTDFVSWTAEFENPPKRQNRRRTSRLRWWTDTMRGPTAPVLLMGAPGGQGLPSFALGQGDGLLARLAQKAAGMAMDMAVDYYFGDEAGEEADAATLKPVESAALPNFVVMAGNPAEASRVLASGLREAAAEVARNPHARSETTFVSILVLPRRLMLARQISSPTTADVEHFVRAAVGVVSRCRASGGVQ